MVITVNRDSGVFSKQQTDEINKAFSIINQKIENYKSEPLEYRNNVSTHPNAFILDDRLMCIRAVFDYEPRGTFQKVLEVPRSVPYEIWGHANNESNESLIIHIKGNTVFAYGSASPGKFYLCVDVVLPN